MRDWWRVAVLGVLLALVVAVPSLLAALGVKAPAVLAGGVVAAAVAGVFAAVNAAALGAVLALRRSIELVVADGCLTVNGRMPLVEQVSDPIRWGVHAARQLGSGENAVPLYVPRDVDEFVRKRLESGGFILLVGDSTAGKSRAGFEAVRAVLPGYTLLAPQDRAALAGVMEKAAGLDRAVVWLDNLERFLGSDGLTRTRASRLLDGGQRVIVATIRSTELDAFQEDEAARRLSRDILDTLELTKQIRLERLFSAEEQKCAAALRRDPLISDALDHADEFGIPEYLAAGPDLLALWHNARTSSAHRRGAALVSAAVDCRRAGLTGPLPGSLIEQLHEAYLSSRGRIPVPPDDISAAWVWASTVRTTTALLTETDRPSTWSVFDYLVDETEHNGLPATRVPDAVLTAVLDHADADDAMRIGTTASHYGAYPIALSAYTRAILAHARLLGPEHPDTLGSRSNLALVLNDLGRLEEAEAENRAVLVARTRLLGPEHPDTMTSRSNLASVLRALGRLEEAEAENRAVLVARSRLLGPEHPDTMTSRGNLANMLWALGRLEQAEAENRAVLVARSRLLGPEHPYTLGIRSNLALVLNDLGRLEEAEAENRAVLVARTRLLGPEHPDTMTSRSNLAKVLQALGRLEEAEAENRAVLVARTRLLGPEHPDTLGSRNNLASVLWALGRLEEAEAEHRAVLDAFTRLLGPEHPDTMTSRSNLAVVLNDLGRSEEAEAENRAVLIARSRLLGPEHPDTLGSHSNQALVLRGLGRLEEAEAEHRAVLDAFTRLLGPEHPETLGSRSNLALVLRALGRLEEAEAENRAVLIARTRLLGPEHPDTMTSRGNLASVLRALGRYGEAASVSH